MRTAELDYDLPEELIAQYPAERRDASRLLVLDRRDESLSEAVFSRLPDYLDAGDCLVLNDTRVIRARLPLRKDTGGRVELFLLRQRSAREWEALLRPAARVKPGATLVLEHEEPTGVRVEVLAALPEGQRLVRFDRENVLELLEQIGAVPLPPYIRREEANGLDAERYQTIYAAKPGAVAAPTAGLHFTEEVMAALAAKGVRRETLTLHVGYGTFKPVKTEDLSEHLVDPEPFELPETTARVLNATRESGGRVCAVGTTVTRALETQWTEGGFAPGADVTDCTIYPPYTFRGVDVLLTNFHLPRSSLLALVCAFGGTDFVKRAYAYAVERRFRFYSYGDAMLIL